MRYEFTKEMVAETANNVNRKFQAGDQFEVGDLLPGVFASLARQKLVVPAPEPAPEPPAESSPAEDAHESPAESAPLPHKKKKHA